jgi:hypothetical protein
MTIEQIVKQMDMNIELLNESLEVSMALDKDEVKERYGSVKTYNECVSMERGACTVMMSFREWIVNNKHK